MHNSLKFVMALIVGVFLFSFQNKAEVKTSTSITKTVVAADTLTWKLLGEIKYVRKKHASYGEVEFPLVNTKLKKLQSKQVVISGFIVPIDNKNYALSKNVFAACFFCGKSGPETIVGLKFKGATPKLKTDTYLTVKGTFKYNETDVENWIYNMEQVEIVAGR
ncbi:Protein of unknown function precursor [Flavobacterium indicum GPTSA100-9 = DSM 17447]|uniref:DUF3299 domain-containing protein n=1 Tax=Flavobacterium indicum (strain DSM 17447 / CIP 109464 / GPTSA100-9) TaxID=1094466 RepID=H8XSF5_FLAIG|nr:hypothetical protein [Flavobacterium indicum]CCG52540.1 Protein of unknown function precursor [Flavobacterium indicum GPTSA100-9 = DSM 17447]